MHFHVHTKIIVKQLQRISDVLLLVPVETQPTRSSFPDALRGVLCASVRFEKVRTITVERTVRSHDVIIGDERASERRGRAKQALDVRAEV